MGDVVGYLLLIPVAPVQFLLCILLMIVKDFLGMGVAQFFGGGVNGPFGFFQLRASFWRMVILAEIILFWYVFAEGGSPDQWLPSVLIINAVGAVIVLLVLAWFKSRMRQGVELMREWEQERDRDKGN